MDVICLPKLDKKNDEESMCHSLWISVKVCLIAENFFGEGVTLCLEGFIPLENRCVPHKGLYLML